MDIPISLLHNQYIQKKNKFPFRIGFVCLFIISVGLNVYLLCFDQKTVVVASLPQDSGKISQNLVEPLQPEAIKKDLLQQTPDHMKYFQLHSSLPQYLNRKY